MTRAVCEACREGGHEDCEEFLSNGDACACEEPDCGANKETKL